MKNFILSVLLLFIVCNVGFAGDLSKRFAVSEEYTIEGHDKNYSSDSYFLIRDKETGIRYLVVKTYKEDYRAGNGIAITPLIKPAVYTHKK